MKKDNLVGNRGEWSEVYVILKLLADGKLYSANENLEKVTSVFYPIVKILRNEAGIGKLEYILNGDIKIVSADSEKCLLRLPIAIFLEKAKEFFRLLKIQKGKSFAIPEIEPFLKTISINSLSAKAADKSDVTLVIHDQRTSTQPELSFSIKSLVGKDATLLNPGPGTNFIYALKHDDRQVLDIDAFNRETYGKDKDGGKISKRINRLIERGFKIDFEKIQSEVFQLNMELIDRDLPLIMSYLLLYKYQYKKNKTVDLLELLKQKNPLNYNLSFEHPFYKYKLVGLLYDYALGMTPEKVWKGSYSTTGGIIIVKEDGDVICYHVYDKNIFQEYLLDNTKLEQPSTSEDEVTPGRADTNAAKKYFYGWVYEENGNYYIKLNLQIRFSKRKIKNKRL